MKHIVLLPALVIMTSAISRSQEGAGYTNFLRQIQLTQDAFALHPGSPSHSVAWDVPVSSAGQRLAQLEMPEHGSVFQLWTVSQEALQSYLLDTKLAHPRKPMGTIVILTEDPYTSIPRTRVDRPFTVDVHVEHSDYVNAYLASIGKTPYNYSINDVFVPDGRSPDEQMFNFIRTHTMVQLGIYGEKGSSMNEIGAKGGGDWTAPTPMKYLYTNRAGLSPLSFSGQPMAAGEQDPHHRLVFARAPLYQIGFGLGPVPYIVNNTSGRPPGPDTNIVPIVDDVAKARGEVTIGLYSNSVNILPSGNYLSGLGSQIASQTIQFWPVADASISGVSQGQLVRYQAPEIVLTLNDLYPDSSTYAQVYKGPQALGTQGTVVPGSSVVINDKVPHDRTLVLKGWDSAIDDNGLWTMEIVTDTPFGVERLAHVTFEVDRTIKVNGSFAGID
jgi:hypothetical protein